MTAETAKAAEVRREQNLRHHPTLDDVFLWAIFAKIRLPMTEQVKDAAATGLTTIDKLRLLLDITKKISRSLDLQEVLNQVMDTLDSVIPDRKSTRLNSSHSQISYAVFCLKK